MFLKFLERMGRKKVVLDRGPSHPKYHEAKPWMNRYYVLLRHRPKWFPFNILIHEMLADDHGEGVHNHTFPYITIVLRGGYWETLETGKYWRVFALMVKEKCIKMNFFLSDLILIITPMFTRLRLD